MSRLWRRQCPTSRGRASYVESTFAVGFRGLGEEIELEAPPKECKPCVSYSGRTYEEGKKITWKDGVAALWHIIRYNLFPGRAERAKLPPLREVVAERQEDRAA